MIAIYARQSIEKKDSLSIESQIEKCINLCSIYEWKDYKIYKDPGYSGKNLDRPAMKTLIEDVKSGKVEAIISYKMDRISRSMRDFINILADFEDCGTKFLSVSEGIDTSTASGKMLVTFIIAAAQMERENIVERVTDNYYYRTKLGYWGGGPAPYGYQLKRVLGKDNKQHTILEQNEKESTVIKNIYHWYLESNMSVAKILDRLNELKIPSSGNSVWTSRVVTEILWRPIYTSNNMDIYNYFKLLNANFVNDISEFDGKSSVNLFGKVSGHKDTSKHKRSRKVEDLYLVVSPHAPIIDSNTWLQVQLKKESKKSRPPREGTGQNSVFTGLMKCGVCGYNVSTNSDGRGHKYYICSTRKNRGSVICSLPMFPHTSADAIVFENIRQHFKDPETKLRIAEARQEHIPSTSYMLRKNTLAMQIASIDNEISNLINSLALGNTTISKYINDKISELDDKKRTIHKKLQELKIKEYTNQHRIDNLDDILNQIDNLESILQNGTFDEIKQLINTLIKQITFYPNNQIQIEYYL